MTGAASSHSLIAIFSNFGWRNANTLQHSLRGASPSPSDVLCFGQLLHGVFMEPPVGCRAHILLFPTALEEARGPICKHPRHFTRARRSRFPHTQPTMLLLHLPPTFLPPCLYQALKKLFHTLPCFWIAWLTHSQNIPLPLFGSAHSWTMCVESLLISYTCVFCKCVFDLMIMAPYYFKPSFLMDRLHLIQRNTIISLTLYLFSFSERVLTNISHEHLSYKELHSPLLLSIPALGGQHAVMRYWKRRHEGSRRLRFSCFPL